MNDVKDTTKQVQWQLFEGTIIKDYQGKKSGLDVGVYYGQLLHGMRDGYGILYTTNAENEPLLFECEWRKGLPIKGSYIQIWENQWHKHYGFLDESFTLTSSGKRIDEDGDQYIGMWKNGKRHGKGKLVYTTIGSYEGEWEFGYYHGYGRRTQQNGEYQDGSWNRSKGAEGMHSFYNKDGTEKQKIDYQKQSLFGPVPGYNGMNINRSSTSAVFYKR
ncbi:hypothetical protein FGO68_gene15861 [Halteria grandinella]|uniref:Uncharacterized protein n=1 Tax=Halteria grandinella TaxID=5974 RepID=A0A8J8T550_HALGN|nr:hypothetical protein FGO68_gene15861 [Halteria grandinella]